MVKKKWLLFLFIIFPLIALVKILLFVREIIYNDIDKHQVLFSFIKRSLIHLELNIFYTI